MKKIILLSTLALVISFVSCSKDDNGRDNFTGVITVTQKGTLKSLLQKYGLMDATQLTIAGTLGEGRIYGHFRTEPGTDGTGTFGICQTEQSGTFQHFCELTRLSEKGYSNRHMRMTRKVRCPYER